MPRILLIVLVAAFGAAGVWWFGFRDSSPAGAGELEIETAEIVERDIERVVASSGRIAPLITVEVGSQLSGQILELAADFNDAVSAGDILARIDPQTFETRVREAEAALEVARAQVSVAQANVQRARAELAAAGRAFERAESLRERGTFSEAQYDTAQTAYENARAGVAVANANLRNAQASLQQREAALNSANVDLERTFIRAPIDGVVIDRQIDEGQTVAASFNAPVLFLIAQDLARVQIEAQIDEADIGQIDEGQAVTFDVDAFPDQEFSGEVVQVRLAALAEQNVVTYTVVIEADNRGGRLLPGMTANVTIVTGQVEGALAAPNAALRFAPRGAAEALVVEAEQSGGRRGGNGQGSEMMDRLAEQLEMTEEQREDVQTAMREAFANMRRQMQADAGGPPPDFQAVIRRTLAGILTAEQMARYDALAAERANQRQDVRRGQVWIETEEGRLQARPVGLGLTDGQYTQILGQGLSAGDRVVTRVREAG
ncbi:MAG: efflux RND transporter periplasmic adaptor subunit [Alphaproteobacteria bacterium]|nr:efflux RND transporter periplasmic adaptor subunit [Alphaproteobacteria bacterium]